MFHEGTISWDLSGTTIGGFVVDPNAGVGGLALKVLGPPALKADGSSTLDVLPGMPPELLGKTPSAPDHLVFGPRPTRPRWAPSASTSTRSRSA